MGLEFDMCKSLKSITAVEWQDHAVQERHLQIGTWQVRELLETNISTILTIHISPTQRVLPENNNSSQSNHGPNDDAALANWDGWGEFILLGKFPAYLGPTLMKMYRAEPREHLTSWELVHCATRGEYGLLLNWGDWTPNELERWEMFEEAEKAAIEEAKET